MVSRSTPIRKQLAKMHFSKDDVGKGCITLPASEFKERILSSDIVYRGRVFNIRKDELKMPSGTNVTREFIDHPGSVAVVPVLNNRTIVMVRQYRHPAGKVLLEIPAGTLERGERPEECAKRELIEETGYRPGNLKELQQCYLAPGYSSELIHIYLATNLSKTVRRPELDEFIETSEVELRNIIDMIDKGEIHDAKTICGVLTFILSHYAAFP